MFDLELELKTILVRELQRNYHFDLKDPSMLLVKNPGTGNPLDKVVKNAASEIVALLEEVIKQGSTSSYGSYHDPDFHD